MIDGAGTHNYTYDTRDRLTAATHPNQTNESYSYEDVGNRTASHQGSSYSYQALNRLLSRMESPLVTNGNLTSKTDGSGSWSYSWDYENRLKQASKSGEPVSVKFGPGLGAFTRHPEGQIGQPFYGWFTDADNLLQAASAALFGEDR